MPAGVITENGKRYRVGYAKIFNEKTGQWEIEEQKHLIIKAPKPPVPKTLTRGAVAQKGSVVPPSVPDKKD